MAERRNTPEWEKHKNKDPENKIRGSKEETHAGRPENRLKDGTNDLQNGDQDPGTTEPGNTKGTTGSSQTES